MKALSIRQPWAWLIAIGAKDVENRTWSTSYRGPVLIHASKRLDRDAYDVLSHRYPIPLPNSYGRGGFIARGALVDVVTESDSAWFTGPYGFVIRDVKRLLFSPYAGRLGLFEVPDAVVDDLAEDLQLSYWLEKFGAAR